MDKWPHELTANFRRVNSMLTICLVTQGRDAVEEFIESAKSFSGLEYVNFLVIDNEAPKEISKLLSNWSANQPRTKVIVCKKNTTNFNELWPLIKENSSDWIIFPGDDDRLLVDGFVTWKSIIERDQHLEAVAMSVKIIDFEGKDTGEIVSPEFSDTSRKEVNLAQALHSPPFVWPSLFIKKSAISGPFPNSRFVFDWWMGLNLVTKHNVGSSKVCVLEYRRHPLQESNMVSLNRKFFEGVYWLDEFLSSPVFVSWVKSIEDNSHRIFWKTVFVKLPLYGDRDLSNLLLFNLAKILMRNSSSRELHNQVLADLSLALGSLQHDANLCGLIGNSSESHFGNLRILNTELVCPILSALLHCFQGSDSSYAVTLSCEHDFNHSDGVYVLCSSYLGRTERQQLDLLVRDISLQLERKGLMVFKISPRERSLILSLRKYKSRIPERILMRMRGRA
jgi:hypothetical protein